MKLILEILGERFPNRCPSSPVQHHQLKNENPCDYLNRKQESRENEEGEKKEDRRR